MNTMARDIMTRNVIVVEKDLSIHNLIETFLKNKISCAPVVNKKKKLVGIVTKTDVLGYFMDLDLDLTLKVGLKDILDFGSERRDLEIIPEKAQKVGDIMTPKPITAEEDTSVKILAEIMISNNIHRLIIENDSAISGIVSTLDILYHVAGIKKKEAEKN
ncbi:MAG: CBS domain-containing protein [Candidatus Glassbacteria bacterium]|nr:CBS domain-containing protein [Candidatus Glassbacteria bacterium]